MDTLAVHRARGSPGPWGSAREEPDALFRPEGALWGGGGVRSRNAWSATPLGLEDPEPEKAVGASEVTVPPTVHTLVVCVWGKGGGAGSATISESGC